MNLESITSTSHEEERRLLQRACLPVEGAPDAEILLFTGGHCALWFDRENTPEIPLVRIHSECLTGDVFGSLRCDCGAQLREARERLAGECGILIYLRQEGRGHGLAHKLKAYQVQDDLKLDTFAADKHLGHAEDVRNYQFAADMLKQMGISCVNLLTNNPEKARELRKYGCEVRGVVPTGYFETPYNRRYLAAKREKGHLFHEG